jgi:hypothetical protein
MSTAILPFLTGLHLSEYAVPLQNELQVLGGTTVGCRRLEDLSLYLDGIGMKLLHKRTLLRALESQADATARPAATTIHIVEDQTGEETFVKVKKETQADAAARPAATLIDTAGGSKSTVTIRVKDQTGEETFVKVKKTTKMEK